MASCWKVRKTATRRLKCAIPNGGGYLSISRSFHRRPSPPGVSRWFSWSHPVSSSGAGFARKRYEVLVPDDLRHPGCRRGIAAALGADDAVDDGHPDSREIAELDAVKDVLAGRMLRLVHDDEVGGAADFDEAAIERAHPRGIAGGKAECDFCRHLAERRQ